MLVYGTCNPEGYGDASYEGLYLTDSDIREITPTMAGVPVKIEHRGVDVGKVITAWIHEGRMDVLMQIDENHIEGAFGKQFVARGMCPELSLGYHVTMSKSPAGFLRASNKKVMELSIVQQGARNGCKIRAFADSTDSKAANSNSNKRARTDAPPASSAAPATASAKDGVTSQLRDAGAACMRAMQHKILF
jgi:hypothetical protein